MKHSMNSFEDVKAFHLFIIKVQLFSSRVVRDKERQIKSKSNICYHAALKSVPVEHRTLSSLTSLKSDLRQAN